MTVTPEQVDSARLERIRREEEAKKPLIDEWVKNIDTGLLNEQTIFYNVPKKVSKDIQNVYTKVGWAVQIEHSFNDHVNKLTFTKKNHDIYRDNYWEDEIRRKYYR